MEKPQIVLCGDSIGCSFKMKIRLNSYGHLLSRRLNKTYAADYITGADTTILLQSFLSNDKMIDDIKNAEIIILTVGGNNVIIAFLEAFIRALGLGPLGARTLPQIGQKLKKDKFSFLKIIREFLSKQTKSDIRRGLQMFEEEFPLVIKKIKELNPNAIILVQTICNPFETVRDIIFLGMSRQVKKPVDIMNKIILEKADEMKYIVADTATALIKASREAEVTNMKRRDIHLTDFGHSVSYKVIYKALTDKYSQYACDENETVYKIIETLTKEELEDQEKEDKLTAAALGERDEQDTIIQPQDFSDGPFKEYNLWFGEILGMKFYPLKKAKICIENQKIQIKVRENIVVKNEENLIKAYNISGENIGKIIDEEIVDGTPNIKEALKMEFPVSIRVIKEGENPEVVVAIYPTYEYYKKSVKKIQKE